jgi:hypothetical protein
MKQRFCLKWNNYQSNVTTTFKELLAVEDFVDITLSAEGGALRAHKVVLSACSPYFRDILKVQNPGFFNPENSILIIYFSTFSDQNPKIFIHIVHFYRKTSLRILNGIVPFILQ